jgi:hypothetical protein
MVERRGGFLEFVAERLRGRELPLETQALYLRHVENYLRFHNESSQPEVLEKLPAAHALDAYIAWLASEADADPHALATARSAIELLYSDVFRIPLTRS